MTCATNRRALRVWSLACLILIGIATTIAHAAPQRFAYAMELMHEPGRTVQSLIVTLPVYQGVQRTDLGDLRVLSADGNEVPHAIRSIGPKVAVERRPLPLPIFPLYAPRRHNDDANDDPALWAIEAETTAQGAVVRVLPRGNNTDNQAAADAGTTPPRPTAILIDASALPHPISTLHVNIEVPSNSTEVSAVAISHSDDLTHWSPLAHGALTRLQHAGHIVDRTDIALPLGRYRYLKMVGADDPLPTVSSIITYAQSETDTRAPLRTRLQGRPAGAPNRYTFDVPGPIPVDTVGVVLPETNTIVSATLSAVRRDQKPLITLWSGIAYRLADSVSGSDGSDTGTPITLGRARFTRFELEVEAKGGGIGAGMPELELSWMPEQLVFVARGEGPFTLVYGSAQAQPTAFNESEIPGIREDLPDNTVLTGPQVTHDGEIALRVEKPATELTQKTLMLWATLVLAVILIAVLALRVLRDRG